MPPRKCCCGECEIGRDEFARADAPTLGPGWDDPDEAWSIVSGAAESTGAGTARFLTPHVLPDESMVAYITTIDETNDSGEKYRVLVNMVDENNYHYVEFERLGSDTSMLRLGKVTSGVGAVIKEDNIEGLTGFTRDVVAKISPLEFCGTVTNAVLSFVGDKSNLFVNGIYSGIESLAAGIRIDRHIFEQHRHTLDPCGHCLCLCETEYIPPVLLATFVDCTGRMSSLNGATITLRWDRLEAAWLGSDPSLCTPGQGWTLRFACPSDELDGSTVILNIDVGCINSDGIGDGPRSPATYTCDPLEWYFGPYGVGPLDLACGCGSPDFDPSAPTSFYSILITEAP